MKTLLKLCSLGLMAVTLVACNKYETYAEQKAKERKYIKEFIVDNEINVISFEDFEAKGYVTDTAKNEYVLFSDNGVYMQIVRKGEGKAMDDGDRRVFMARYYEYNIEDADTITGNLYANTPDYFTCERTGDSYSASFTQGYMYSAYGGTVPSGWLVPFAYITPGRPNNNGAFVKLIVPHSEGTKTASQYVYPTYYEINFIPEP